MKTRHAVALSMLAGLGLGVRSQASAISKHAARTQREMGHPLWEALHRSHPEMQNLVDVAG